MCPSPDQTGFQPPELEVTTVTSPPVDGTDMISLRGLLKNAMRSPCGDQEGVSAPSFNTRCFRPVATSIRQSSPLPANAYGLLVIGSVETAKSFPSGYQAGLNPKSLTRLTVSPVAPITKMPPPSRSERKAIS